MILRIRTFSAHIERWRIQISVVQVIFNCVASSIFVIDARIIDIDDRVLHKRKIRAIRTSIDAGDDPIAEIWSPWCRRRRVENDVVIERPIGVRCAEVCERPDRCSRNVAVDVIELYAVRIVAVIEEILPVASSRRAIDLGSPKVGVRSGVIVQTILKVNASSVMHVDMVEKDIFSSKRSEHFKLVGGVVAVTYQLRVLECDVLDASTRIGIPKINRIIAVTRSASSVIDLNAAIGRSRRV